MHFTEIAIRLIAKQIPKTASDPRGFEIGLGPSEFCKGAIDAGVEVGPQGEAGVEVGSQSFAEVVG